MIQTTSTIYGRDARDLRAAMSKPGIEGARACLETFYFSFNNGDARVLRDVWRDDPLVRLANPLGGICQGVDAVVDLYTKVFDGPASVWVEFYDIVEYRAGDDMVVFSGRERGTFAVGDTEIDLDIRTSRGMAFATGSWAQVHHHGSITDVDLLGRYQAAVLGSDPA